MIAIKERIAPTFLFAIRLPRSFSLLEFLSRNFLDCYLGRMKTIKVSWYFIIEIFVAKLLFEISVKILAY
jgi:hypothetical protein